METFSSTILEQKFISNFNELNFCNNFQKLAIAVSGGVDSVALLLLIHKWASNKDVKLTILTVNHNLRSEAKFETEYVYKLSKTLGHKCIILNWDHGNKFSNLSARAREGRYMLMTACCHDLDILTLLTAHHLDDSIENFLIKSERKSGILGLNDTPINFYNNIRVLRLLFNIKKSELIAYVKSQDVKWMEDESNTFGKYLRNRIRGKIALEDESFTGQILEKRIFLEQQASNINEELIEAIGESASIYHYGFASLSLEKFENYQYEVKLRIMIFLLNVISGNVKAARAESINSVLPSFQQGRANIKTLHGCIIKKVGCKLLIYREFGKKSPPDMLLRKNIKWDGRFFLKSQEERQGTYITKLTLKDYIEIKDKINLTELAELSFKHHKDILFTLPVIKTLEKVIALPHISFYNDCNLIDKLSFSYQPNFTSRLIHFY